MKTILEECTGMVLELAGHGYLCFETALSVKTSPHSFPFAAWAVCVSPDGGLYVMDADEQWHAFDVQDRNAALLLGSLYQRLRMMHHHFKKAS